MHLAAGCLTWRFKSETLPPTLPALKSNEVGRYEIGALNPGNYEITAGKAGFRHVVAQAHQAGRPASGAVVDLTMQVPQPHTR